MCVAVSALVLQQRVQAVGCTRGEDPRNVVEHIVAVVDVIAY